MKVLAAFVLAVALMALLPVSASAASIGEKCNALVTELNQRRSPDVRLRSLLCDIAHKRSIQQAKGRTGHNIKYVVRRLNEAGVCWRNVGEAIAWTTATGTTAYMADRFLTMWRNSPTHWSMLGSSIYDRAGGSWRASAIGDGRTYATLLVADFC